MRKKILVAEKSDAIRSIAESLLHTQGFDVISASTPEKAKELIVTSEPNMIIIGADLADGSGQPLYETIGENPQTKGLPLLLIEAPDKTDLPYPSEIVLPRPFEPDDFTSRVSLFLGGGDTQKDETITESDPFKNKDLNDDFLDAALGLDKIEIEESKEVDKTEITGKIPVMKKPKKKDIFEVAQDHANGYDEESGKVESLMIRETESGKIKAEVPKAENLTASSKIELNNDQYGLITPDDDDKLDLSDSPQPVKKDHDYNWFIDEMKKDSIDPTKSKKPQETSADDGELKKVSSSETLESVKTPSNKSKDIQPGLGIASDEPQINPGGVEQFISDFKKEMKDIGPNDSANKKNSNDSSVATAVETKIEISQADLHRIAGHLVEMLAEKLAKKIVERIDKDEIYSILKDDLAEYVSRQYEK